MTPRFMVLGVASLMALAGWHASGPDRRVSDVPAGVLSPNGRLVGHFDTDLHEFRVDTVGQSPSKPLARVTINGYVGSSAISWDDRMVAFSSGIRGEGAGVRIVALSEGAPTPPRLLLKGGDIDPVEWSRDGTRLLVAADLGNRVELRLVDVRDGTSQALRATGYIGGPESLSPDASELAYAARAAGTGRHRAIFLLSTSGTPPVQVLDSSAWNTVVGWSPSGDKLVIFSDRGGTPGLWALPIRNGGAAGEPRLLTAVDGQPIGTTLDGGILYERVTGPPAARLVTMKIDTDGQAQSAPTSFHTRDRLVFTRFPKWSTDGQLFLYIESRSLGPTVAIHSNQSQRVRELPLDLTFVYSFDWSRDGRLLVFKGNTLDGGFCLCLMDTTTGVLKVLKLQAAVDYLPRFSETGTSVAYFKKQPSPQTPSWSLAEWRLDAGAEYATSADLSRLMADPKSYPAGRSPDGRYVLAKIAGDTSRLMLLDTTTSEVREIFHAAGDEAFNHYGDLTWTPDSRAVITTIATTPHDDGNEQELWWIPVDGRSPHKIASNTTLIGENPIAISADGRQIAFVAGQPFNAVMPFDFRPSAMGSRVELRILERLVPASGR